MYSPLGFSLSAVTSGSYVRYGREFPHSRGDYMFLPGEVFLRVIASWYILVGSLVRRFFMCYGREIPHSKDDNKYGCSFKRTSLCFHVIIAE